MPVSSLIDRLVETCVEAGEHVMRHYRPGVAVSRKGDGSPVTDADRDAEAAILAALARIAPGVGVVAEEEAAAGRTPERCDRFFLVDPLDGTKEFIGGNGEFTVNIALIEDGMPVAGVVHAPALGRIFAGCADGAWQGTVEGGRVTNRLPIRVRPAARCLVVVGSRSHGSDETARWLERFEIDAFVARGSSLKFCLLASGEADLYPRFGRTMEWDTAAGDAVLRAAGGIVTTLDGRPLTYNKRRRDDDCDFSNPHFVAYGDPAIRTRAGEMA